MIFIQVYFLAMSLSLILEKDGELWKEKNMQFTNMQTFYR